MGDLGEGMERLTDDPLHPMMDRSISGVYPPGSTFKAMVALAALEEKEVTTATSFFCAGEFQLGTRTFKCWKRWGHGTVRLVTALQDSCDVYFYQVGLRLGINRLVEWGKRFGLGTRTGIDIPGEAEGNIAGIEWKKERFREPWYKGDTVNYSIGQGFLLMTPLQIARMYAFFAKRSSTSRNAVSCGEQQGASGSDRTFSRESRCQTAGACRMSSDREPDGAPERMA